MKTVVFSDSHLCLPFEEKKFIFLKHIITQADRVIINGDLWDAFNTDFRQFIDSPWKNLFPLLKEKNTVYIFGNHDKPAFNDKETNLFSDIQTSSFRLRLKDKIIVFEHGHSQSPGLREARQPYGKTPKAINIGMNMLEKMLVRRTRNRFHKKISSNLNRFIKRRIAMTLKNNEWFICGHTHAAEFDRKKRFINTGFVQHGLGQYLLIDNNDLNLKEEWYA